MHVAPVDSHCFTPGAAARSSAPRNFNPNFGLRVWFPAEAAEIAQSLREAFTRAYRPANNSRNAYNFL